MDLTINVPKMNGVTVTKNNDQTRSMWNGRVDTFPRVPMPFTWLVNVSKYGEIRISVRRQITKPTGTTCLRMFVTVVPRTMWDLIIKIEINAAPNTGISHMLVNPRTPSDNENAAIDIHVKICDFLPTFGGDLR